MMYLCLLVLAAAVAVHAENSYVVVSPAKIRPNMNLALSVNILRSNGDVVVRASVMQGATVVISGSGTFRVGTPSTLTLKIPASLPSATYQLKVEGSGGLTFINTTDLAYNSKELSLFIQTDKAIYKPGETVNFRALGTYPDLKTYTGLFDISITDAAGNKIKQWLQEQPVNSVVTKLLNLSAQPVLGDWKISLKAGNANVEKVFTVAEYVLPKFEVTVQVPSYALTSDSDLTVTVKAKYTYGKPVKGTANVGLKFLYSYRVSEPSSALPISTVEANIDGEVKVTFPMSDVKKFTVNLDGHFLVVVANVSESLTGNTMSGNGTVKLHDKPVKLEFPATNAKTFKPGLQYIAYLKVSQPDGLPIASTNQKVKVTTSMVIELPGLSPTPSPFYQKPTENRQLPEAQFDVPTNGLVAIPLDFPRNAKSATIMAEFQTVRTTLYLGKSHSPSDSYVQLVLASAADIKAGDLIRFRVKATQPIPYIVYQILSRGGIVKTGRIDTMSHLDHPFTILTDDSMAPNARMVAYYVTSAGEIVTDSISFDVSGAFKNKVTIKINTTDAEPGDEVKVTVTADPSSTAHLLAIDQSVLLLKSGNDITPQDVYDELRAYDTTDTSDDFGGLLPICRNCARRKRAIWWPYPIFPGGNDAAQVFKMSGVKVITDALVFQYIEPIRNPCISKSRFPLDIICVQFMERLNPEVLERLPVNVNVPLSAESLAEPARVRTNFPETWLWNTCQIGANGSASVETIVPDTITSWVASAFAVNSVSGLGVALDQAKIRVFRPFFVSLNLPYSVTRGEQLALQAIVFNYMQEDMQVRVTLMRSRNFSNIAIAPKGKEELNQEDATQDVFVKAGEAKSVYFPIVPTDIGKIDVEVKAQTTRAADAIRRQLLVEAEGVPKEYNIPMLVDLTDGRKSFSETTNISLPANVVKGSARIRITVVGDLMGPTISGLDSLLQMPMGCGEQTLLSLAPDVAITDYLQSVNQLTSDIKTKAISYMESGYQRELTYKHKDGSFSAFGESDASGSMWLTAFVIRVFHQARPYIFIDQTVLVTSIRWIIGKQNSDGSFPEPGNVIHKDMQGGSGGGLGLTLFVLISLLENRDVMTAAGIGGEQAIAKALAYCEVEVAKTDDLYILAIASYALQLANSAQTKPVLDKLELKATIKDGLKYWHKEVAPQTTTSTWQYPIPTIAIDTEITSYISLTYTARNQITQGKSIIHWIIKQRNPHGGFQSTQDTVVALQALAQFAKQIFSNNFNLVVTAAVSSTETYTFHVDQTNALILQIQETTTIPVKIRVEASGSGIALVGISVFFNVESEIEKVTFDLSVKIVEETINYLVLETCTSWRGEGLSSGMAVMEIGIPSGFEADTDSITRLPILKRKETQNKKVILYFDQIGTQSVCITIRIVRTGLVAKSQPVPVRVYDYYSPNQQVTKFYQSKVLKDSSVCDVCKDCDNCV